MKQCFSIIKTACVFVSSLFLFVACQKNTQLDNGTSVASAPLQNMVNQWVAAKVKEATGSYKTQLQYLSDHLQLDKAETNQTSDGRRQVTIVPLSDQFVSLLNKGLPVTNNLVLVQDQSGKFIFDFVMQFVPKNGTAKQQIPAKMFTKFFTDNSKVDFKVPDGQYCMLLTTVDRPLGRFVYANNQETSFSNVSGKPTGKPSTASYNPGSTTNRSIDDLGTDCTAWYWVTTDNNGDETWTYMYTTCEGNGGGGGGGDGGDGSQSLTSVTSLQPWTVVQGTYVNWSVISNEKLNGDRNATTGKGNFTSISHLSFKPAGGCTFSGDAVTALTGQTTAKSEVAGIVGFGGTPSDVNIGKVSQTFSFNSISW